MWKIPGVSLTVIVFLHLALNSELLALNSAHLRRRHEPQCGHLRRTRHLDNFQATLSIVKSSLKKFDLQAPRSLLSTLSTRISQVFGSLPALSLVLMECDFMKNQIKTKQNGYIYMIKKRKNFFVVVTSSQKHCKC